jgi:hypothetical protein
MGLRDLDLAEDEPQVAGIQFEADGGRPASTLRA